MTTLFWRGMNWREVIDSLGHAVHLPRRLQRPICDWIDRNFYP